MESSKTKNMILSSLPTKEDRPDSSLALRCRSLSSIRMGCFALGVAAVVNHSQHAMVEAFHSSKVLSNPLAYDNKICSNKYLERNGSALFISSPLDSGNRDTNDGFTSSNRNDQDRFIRIRKGEGDHGRTFELQTCVRRFSRREPDGSITNVDLHAQVHFGDQKYFQFYNSEKFESQYDNVLYELIISDDLAVTDENGNRRVLEELMPSISDSQIAMQYDLGCQLDIIKYNKPGWLCADVSKEYLQYKEEGIPSDTVGSVGFEMLGAIVRPATPAGDGLKTKLFSNLFLAGDLISSVLRLSLWLVPLPELSVILLDWSTLSPRPGGLSPVTFSVIESISRGDFKSARKLVFSQMIVSGQANEGSDSVLIGERNEVAVKTLEGITENKSESIDRVSKQVAMLYGGLHCRNLERKLKLLGFTKSSSDWRTAWKVKTSSDANNFTGSALLIPMYFFVSGADWYDAIVQAAIDVDSMNGMGAVAGLAFYFARHVILYFGLARFVLEWDGTLFGEDSNA